MRPDPRTSGRRAPAHRRGRRGRRHQCRPVDRRRRRPFFEAAKAYLGAIDIAVINAAIPASALADSGESEARYQLDTDLTAYLICAQEAARCMSAGSDIVRSEEHTSELQSLMRISYAVVSLHTKKIQSNIHK